VAAMPTDFTDDDLEQFAIELGRDSLTDFTRFTYQNYDTQWYHQKVADKLDDVLSGKIRKIMFFMPPQHGKSELVSRRFPAYALGRAPKTKLGLICFDSTIAEGFNRDVQRIIDDPEYSKLFPETYLNKQNVATDSRGRYLRNSTQFETVNHCGGLYSVGVGSALTSKTLDIGIIDDPIKDGLTAYSLTFRERLWDWYLRVFKTRMHNESRLILCQTRWHEDDLAGRILNTESDWEVVSIPAIKEDNHDPDDPRQIGDTLWPQKHALKDILDLKEQSERVFISMYQQRPAPSEGGMFKADNFRYYGKMPERFDRIIQSWDCAFTATKDSSFVVGTIWGTIGIDAYLLGMARGQWDFVETVKQMRYCWHAFPYSQEKLIEKKANGDAIISTLREEIPGITPITPIESKEARAFAVSWLFEGHHVFFPAIATAPWVSDITHELTFFPNAPNDDITDSITQALRFLFLKRVSRLFHMGPEN
jgi:predicted phage terminase large subunit-like protein